MNQNGRIPGSFRLRDIFWFLLVAAGCYGLSQLDAERFKAWCQEQSGWFWFTLVACVLALVSGLIEANAQERRDNDIRRTREAVERLEDIERERSGRRQDG